jgi:hypothetical protein
VTYLSSRLGWTIPPPTIPKAGSREIKAEEVVCLSGVGEMYVSPSLSFAEANGQVAYAFHLDICERGRS